MDCGFYFLVMDYAEFALPKERFVIGIKRLAEMESKQLIVTDFRAHVYAQQKAGLSEFNPALRLAPA